MSDFYIEAKKDYEEYSLEDLYKIFENFDCDFYGWPEVMDALIDTIKEKENIKVVTHFWWYINDIESKYYGEQFITEAKGKRLQHYKFAEELFPNENIHCLGQINDAQVEALGLDIYVEY